MISRGDYYLTIIKTRDLKFLTPLSYGLYDRMGENVWKVYSSTLIIK